MPKIAENTPQLYVSLNVEHYSIRICQLLSSFCLSSENRSINPCYDFVRRDKPGITVISMTILEHSRAEFLSHSQNISYLGAYSQLSPLRYPHHSMNSDAIIYQICCSNSSPSKFELSQNRLPHGTLLQELEC